MSVHSPVGARPVTGDTLEGVAVDFPNEIKNLRTTMASVREVLDAVDEMRGTTDMSRAEFFDFLIDSAVRRAAGLPQQ